MSIMNYAQSGNVSIYDAIAEPAEPETAAQDTQEAQEGQKKRKARKEYTPEQEAEFKSQMRTTGRKGVKMSRINLAFTPENYEYVQIMGRVSGEGMTAFVNKALQQHREEHRDLYDRAIEFKNAIDNYGI